MALKAGNEVVGGNTLRRAAIQSPNFVTGVSGWSINQDGSAEFNNVVIRNGQVVSGTALFYSGAPALGNLVASIAAAASTDSKGNAYLAGVTSYGGGGTVASSSNGGSSNFYTAAGPAGPWNLQGAITITSGGILQLQGNLRAEVLSALQADAPVTITAATLSTLLSVVNSTAGAAVQALLTVAAAGDPFFACKVAGDTSNRLLIDTTNTGLLRIRLGPGNAGVDTTIERLSPNLLGLLATDLAIDTAGRGLQVKEGANAKQGTAILAAGSVVVANTAVTASSRIYPGYVTPSANAGAVFCSAITPGTGFTLKSTNAADTSTVSYLIVEAAP